MNTTGLMLPPHGVTVLWDWEWTRDQDGDGDISREGDPETRIKQPVLTWRATMTLSQKMNSHHHILLCVMFKCIGSTHDSNAQEVLFKTASRQD